MARGFWDYWYLNLPSLVLAVLMYLLLARGLLSLVLREANPVMRLLATVTAPAYGPVAAITPRIVPTFAVAAFAMAWLFVLRLVLHFAASFIR